MLGLAIRKWFYDLWDTMAYNLLLNLGFLALLILPFTFAGSLQGLSPLLAGLSLFGTGLFISVYIGLVSRITRDYVDNVSLSIKTWPKKLRESLLPSLVSGSVNSVIGVGCYFAFPYYFKSNDPLNLGLLAFSIWFLVFYQLAMQFWLPLNATFEKKPIKLFKKSLMLLLDNPLYTIGMGIWSLVIVGIPFALIGIVIDYSILFGLLMAALGIFPGITGLTLWHHEAFQLRMLKYDYLEKNPAANRRRLPWKKIILDERAKVGTRSLRDLFMPVRGGRNQ